MPAETTQANPEAELSEKTRRKQTRILTVLLVLPVVGLDLVYFGSLGNWLFWLGIALIMSLGLAVLYAQRAHRMGFFEEVLLAEVFVMSLIGIGLTNVSPQSGLRFWLAMSLLMAVSALVMGTVQNAGQKTGKAKFLVTQLVHWGATLLTIGAVFALFRAGRLNHDNTALVLLLVLGLSTFLDGYRISWRFAVIGVLIAGTTLMAAYIEQYTWPMMIIGLVLLSGVIAIEWLRHKRAR